MTAVEVFDTDGVAGTEALGRQIAQRLGKGDCVALRGELGAGKTALVRGLAGGMGLADTRLVSSPTYVLVQEYPADVTVYHLDLYRMSSAALELGELGLEEMLDDPDPRIRNGRIVGAAVGASGDHGPRLAA